MIARIQKLQKYALSILDEDRDKAIIFLKQAAESFARSKEYGQLEEIWPILIEHNFEDLPFFEKLSEFFFRLEKNRES